MTSKDLTEIMSATEESVRSILKSQYHAALAMLRQGIELCPPKIWADEEHINAVWQIAYHTLFFAHLYMQPNEEAFEPWEHHQAEVQVPDCIPGPPDEDSPLPLIPDPYPQEQLLEYCILCDEMVDETVDSLDIFSPESGFSWYPVPKLEHQIVNIRHIQHGAAQIADRIRAAADLGIAWAGAQRSTND